MRMSVLAVLAALACASAPPALAEEQATDRGAVSAREGQPIFMIRYRPGTAYRPETPLLQQDLRAHGRYMQELTQRGIILAAGPTMAEPGGLVLLQAADMAEARALMMADPAVRSGLFLGEISDWRPAFDPGARFGSRREQP